MPGRRRFVDPSHAKLYLVRMTQDVPAAAGVIPEKGLVLFSGGQDSTTCLAWALERFSSVETVGFDYGPRHRVELECRNRIRSRMVELNAAWEERLGDEHTIGLASLGEVSD